MIKWEINNGDLITNLRCADDGVLMTFSPEELQRMLDKFVSWSESKTLPQSKTTEHIMVVIKITKDKTVQLHSKDDKIKGVKTSIPSSTTSNVGIDTG